MKRFTNLGFNNWLSIDSIDVVQIAKGAPVTRYIQEARERHALVDVTQGRKVKSAVVLKSGIVVVSAMAPDTIIGRIEGLNNVPRED